MADCGVVSERDASRAADRKRMNIRRIKFLGGVSARNAERRLRQARLTISPASFSELKPKSSEVGEVDVAIDPTALVSAIVRPRGSAVFVDAESIPRFGASSVCGGRRDMEDAVSIHPSFFMVDNNQTCNLHYFGVYDGHGCSHVAARCKDRLHLLVKQQLNATIGSMEWKKTMERSFNRMDKEVTALDKGILGGDCRCQLQLPESDAVGSTAVVAIETPDKIIVANCGDSRAVLCRNGKATPLSNDHKPDRPDELSRIQTAGGRVVYWDGARVLGVLAMSRSIGDSYLKPYVSCVPEVTVTERTAEDNCLIIASDGLWDVVTNDNACEVAETCLKGKGSSAAASLPESDTPGFENSDKACSEASLLLTRLALAKRSTDNVSVVVINLR